MKIKSWVKKIHEKLLMAGVKIEDNADNKVTMVAVSKQQQNEPRGNKSTNYNNQRYNRPQRQERRERQETNGPPVTECSICGLCEMCQYLGRKPPFTKHLLEFDEDVFVMIDPFKVCPCAISLKTKLNQNFFSQDSLGGSVTF